MMGFYKVTNIRKSYKLNSTLQQEVLKGIDLEFRKGELVALLGESGCGKSTLINILGGLDMDYTGSIILREEFMRDYTEKQMDDYRKSEVGIIFQNYQLISHMNLLENVEIAMSISDVDEKIRKDRAMELLKMIGLDEFYAKYPAQLSGGQKQRVAIARALANNPSIILADEPTGALDKESADIILEILKKIAESGRLVIIVTHSQKVAESCNRVITLDDGVVKDDVTVGTYKSNKGKKIKGIEPKNIKFKDLVKIAIRNVKQKKSRNFIVSCGMAVGIAAVIIILCLSAGLVSYVNDVLVDGTESLHLTVTKTDDANFYDTELEMIAYFDGIDNMVENSVKCSSTYYTYVYNDADADNVDRIYSLYNAFAPSLLYGLLPSDGEVLINQSMAMTMTEDDISTLLNTDIQITVDDYTITYTISGIYEDTSVYYDEQNIYLTSTNMEELFQTDELDGNVLYIDLEDASYIESVKTDLETMGYTVEQKDSSVYTIMSYIDMGTGVLIGVAAISLMVAAILIYIVMHISIVERTKEIGIMRSIGARRKDIKRLFNTESTILGIMGGGLGCIFALVISLLTNIACVSSLDHTILSYNPLYYLLGFVSCVLISILSGIAPSVNASNLDPVESLRAE
jgi:ABC-type lipoprotein export system ATPase subunit/ABC-type antimicrobial peptide transport system permease subunit